MVGEDAKDRAVSVLYKNCSGGGAIPMAVTYPYMPFTWNNKVSAIDIVAIGGLILMYDKVFYFKHLGTWVHWGFNKQCIQDTYANDRMTSGLSL